MRNNLERLWVFAILFINGWTFALPVTEETMPIWLTPVQLIHGIFIHELLLMAYLGFLVVKLDGYLPIRRHGASEIAFLIFGLALLGVLSNAINFQLLQLMGACRLFLLAIYFLLSIHWAKKYGPTFVLRTLLFGIASSGAINIYYAFKISPMELGGLPFLLGQNGPGGPLGISVVLSAWLMLVRKTLFDTTIALATGAIGVFGSSISYSKLSMLMAGFGLIAWVFVLCLTIVGRRSRRLTAMILAILLAIAFANQDLITRYLQGVDTFINYKFVSMDDRSIETRSQYFIITAEILLRHPLLGVGYGGFYDAATATEGYKSNRSTEEDAEAGQRGESNPHSSFLYYASANGLPGLLLTMLLFIMVLRAYWRTLSRNGMSGRVLWVCLAVSYFIFGMTLPTLFNTAILYVPAAVGISLRNHTRSGTSMIRAAIIPIPS